MQDDEATPKDVTDSNAIGMNAESLASLRQTFANVTGPDSSMYASVARMRELATSPALASMVENQRLIIEQTQASMRPAIAMLNANQEALIRSLQPLFRHTLSRAEDFRKVDADPSPYSPELRDAGSYFEKDEEEVTSFEELNSKIVRLIAKNPTLDLVWRGQQNSKWGLHSSLFRSLMQANGVKPPETEPTGPQPYPEEPELMHAENHVLQVARDLWRLDHMSALEIFARLQHHGAPTRLIDVTRNPFIGAWFAVEHDEEHDDSAARLFAVATTPVRKEGTEAVDNRIRLDNSGSQRDPFWHHLNSPEDRQAADWGTGALRRIWIPPAYDDRIVAQNAGFLLDGVPMISSAVASYFRIGSESKYWKKADLLAASSIYLKTAKPSRTAKTNARNLAPTFTFKISPQGKADIRRVLETRFSYNHSTIYPDISGLARFLSGDIKTFAQN